ncbi:MAG: helix-turn-helix transcriptional regulator [Rhodospirillales bacterium]|nr:helix-turn-helix transcriptional regulator [Rhodospirillales bacterium]
MVDFVSLMYGQSGLMTASGPRLRGVQWTRLANEDLLDASGFPTGSGWEEVELTLTDDRQAYIVELDVDVAPPMFRRGDMLVVSPGSGLRRGDRVLLRLRQGPIQVGVLNRRSAQRLTLADPAGREAERTIAAADVAWLARIVWLSQ